MPTEGACENCGQPATGNINGHPFCRRDGCIDAIIKVAMRPIQRSVRDALMPDDPPVRA